MWYLSEAIQCVTWVIVTGVVAWALIRYTPITTWWIVTGASVLIVGSIIATIVMPGYRYKYWLYEIRDDEVDLQYGFVMQKRQLIPMSRIQHVDTRRGPLQRRFGLSSVVFYTAAGSMEIPALSQQVAADVRDRIAELAKVHDDI